MPSLIIILDYLRSLSAILYSIFIVLAGQLR